MNDHLNPAETQHGEKTKAGFVAVLGLPNAGKSTLINTLVGTKVSIVSRKVQTTRNRILGIALHGAAQVILIDTPGVFQPKKTLERAMVKAAFDSIEDADAIVHLVDVSAKNIEQNNQIILERLPKNRPVLLVLNKVDKIDKIKLLEQSKMLNDAFPYAGTYMISGLKGQGVNDLLDGVGGYLPDSPWLFEEDQVTDMPMRLMAAEITREKIFDQLHEELPYSIMVKTEEWENFDNGDIKIRQVIYVQKDSQKSIVLGKGGTRIKQIGVQARKELEECFESKVHLNLFVKVQKNWDERAENYQLIGLDLSS